MLRPNQPRSACAYPGDDDPSTAHFGAYVGEQRVGIASVYREDHPDRPSDAAYRLRGMATLGEMRGAGFGAALLRACIAHAGAGGGVWLWCNARTPACGFYARLGFAQVGDEFEIEGIGPHFRMERRLDADPSPTG